MYAECKSLSLREKGDFEFQAFHLIINLNFSLVKLQNLFKNIFHFSPFNSQNSVRKNKILFGISNNWGGIIISFLFVSLLLLAFFLNSATTVLMNLSGKFALLNFPLIFLTFLKKLENIVTSHLKKHQNNLDTVTKSLSKDEDSMVNKIGINLTLVLLKCISRNNISIECYLFKLRTKN